MDKGLTMQFLLALTNPPDFAGWDVAHVEFDADDYGTLKGVAGQTRAIQNCVSINIMCLPPVFSLSIFKGIADPEDLAGWEDAIETEKFVRMNDLIDLPFGLIPSGLAQLGLGEMVVCRDRVYWELWPKHEGPRFETEGLSLEYLEKQSKVPLRDDRYR